MAALTQRLIGSARKRLELSRRISRLAADPFSAALMVASFNSGAVRKRLGLSGLLPVEGRIAYGRHRFPIRFERVFEYHVLLEIFGALEYECDLDREPSTIIDLGANVGLSTIFFRLKYPSAKIHAIEADPTAFRALERNLRSFSDVELHNVAIAPTDGVLQFFTSADHAISSSLVRRRPDQVAVDVTALRFDTLLDRIGAREVDLVKFDVEGAERSVFEHAELLDRIRHLIGELHVELTGWSPEDLAAHFRGFDLRVLRRDGDRAIVELIRSER